MKGIKGYTFTCNDKRHTGQISGQFLFQGYIYLYLAQNKLPSNKSAIKIEVLTEKYTLLGSLLFKIASSPEKETVVLAILKVCADKIMMIYNSSLFAGHQGVIKTYLTINNKFFILNLIHYLHYYIKGWHIVIYTNLCTPKSH